MQTNAFPTASTIKLRMNIDAPRSHGYVREHVVKTPSTPQDLGHSTWAKCMPEENHERMIKAIDANIEADGGSLGPL